MNRSANLASFFVLYCNLKEKADKIDVTDVFNQGSRITTSSVKSCSFSLPCVSFVVVSSPEHKVLKVSYCDGSSEVRRPSVRRKHFFKEHLQNQ